MKHAVMVAGFAVGAASILGGIAVQWGRVSPQFKVPDSSIEIFATPKSSQITDIRNQSEAKDLTDTITAFSNKYPGKLAVATTDLATGATASVNGDTKMVTGSVFKIYVAYGIYQKIDAGQMSVNDPLPNHPLTVGQCLYLMITISDNSCGYALGKVQDWAKLDAILAAKGYKDTTLNNYNSAGELDGDKYTTAHDIQKLFVELYRGQLLSTRSNAAFIALLKADKLNYWLTLGLPKGTVLAHKPGAVADIVHDAGIVYSDKGDYMVVVMTRGWGDPDGQAPPVIGAMSRELWDFYTQKY